jgi:hypothetical protein
MARRRSSARSGRLTHRRWSGCTLVGLHSAVSPGTLHHHVLLARPTLSLEAAARFSDVDYGSRAVGLGAGAEGLWLGPRVVVWLVHSPAWQLLRLATVRGQDGIPSEGLRTEAKPGWCPGPVRANEAAAHAR